MKKFILVGLVAFYSLPASANWICSAHCFQVQTGVEFQISTTGKNRGAAEAPLWSKCSYHFGISARMPQTSVRCTNQNQISPGELLLNRLAQAKYFSPGINNALSAAQQTIESFKRLEMHQLLENTLRPLVQTAAFALEKNGHSQEAQQLLREGAQIEETFFKRTRALGDHRPLSQWIAKTYKNLERLLGKSKMEELHLIDLFIINYAVPVVIEPTKNWGLREYGRHFVPLSGVVTYWSSLGVCMPAVNGVKAYIYCDRVAKVLKRGMIAEIGPRLSDVVYRKFNDRGFRGDLNVTIEQLVGRFGPELNAIRE